MKYWVFDLDGTLVDSHSVYFQSLQRVFDFYQKILTDEDKKEVLRIAVKDRPFFFAERIGADHVPEAIKLLETYLFEDDIKIEIFEGIKSLLLQLKAQDSKIALWTAREMTSAKRVLESTGLAPFFSFFMSGSCVAHCKPNPEGLLRIAKVFNCEASALSMVGDHDNDMLAAKACGARAIRALWNEPKNSLPECHLSDLNFSEVKSLSQWLSNATH